MSRYDVVVVGSGPGGSVTAAACARRGLRVLVVEEGPWVEPESLPAYSWEQMRSQYRNGGLTVALGRPPIAYTEGRCAGGGSEVNAGLYHRPSAELLEEWSRDWAIDGLDPATLAPHLAAVEERLCVASRPAGPLPPASALLSRGAERLGWSGREVPRWMRGGAQGQALQRQTMTRTYLADALAAGTELRTGSRAVRVLVERDRVRGVLVETAGRRQRVEADQVVVCAGAIHTPALLQRSGIGGARVGRGLAVHPTVKAVAETDHDMVDPHDVPSFQVREFHPLLGLGGSASGPGMVALALVDTAEADPVGGWRRRPVYYAAIRPRGRGRVRAVPGFDDPLVGYRLTRADLELLRSGLARLAHLLLAAGARRVLPAYAGARPVTRPDEVAPAAEGLTRARASVMTVHLCGTVGMGEDPRRSAADSFGRVHGVTGLRVNDASLLPGAPGINPQGTVMALAHRNVTRFLQEGR